MKRKDFGALIIVPVLSIIISFLIGCIIIAALGASPAEALRYLWKGAFGNIRNLGTTFSRSTPCCALWRVLPAAVCGQRQQAC